MANEFLSPVGDLETYFVDEYTLIDQFVGDQLWTWGENKTGQLGLGIQNINEFRSNPTLIDSGNNNWKIISTGGRHIAAIKTDGTLWTWGNNTIGQLGTGDTTIKNIPTQVGIGDYWVDVSCGGAYTIAIRNDGTLWSWGNNDSGQLGIGSTTSNPVPNFNQIGISSDWKYIHAGRGNASAIKVDGSLWVWGSNEFGQLGLGTDKVGIITSLPTRIGIDTNWKMSSVGNEMMAAIKNDGSLWVWGSNVGEINEEDGDTSPLGYGRLGFGDTLSRYLPTRLGSSNDWKYVNCGRFTAAIKTNGTLWTWGRNAEGQLGRGYFSPDDSIDSRVWSPVQVGIGSNWKTVSCGNLTMMAIKTDGTMWVSGSNKYYQLTNTSTSINSSNLIQINKGSQNWKYVDTRFTISVAISIGINPVVP